MRVLSLHVVCTSGFRDRKQYTLRFLFVCFVDGGASSGSIPASLDSVFVIQNNNSWTRIIVGPSSSLKIVAISSATKDSALGHKVILFKFAVLNFAQFAQTLYPFLPHICRLVAS